MKSFHDMKIGTKLVSVFFLLIIISGFIGYLINTDTDNMIVSIIAVLLLNIIMSVIFGVFVSNSVNKPIKEVEKVLDNMAVNDFTVEVKGNYSGTMKELAQHINDVRTRLLSVQDAMIRISKGDLGRLEEGKKIGRRSENDKMVPALLEANLAIKNLIDEVTVLSKAAVEGNLKVRGDADKFEGGYKEIIAGFNKTLDSIVEPLSASIKVLDNFGLNDYTINMSDGYKGEFDVLAKAINVVHTRLTVLQRVASKMAVGDMSELEGLKKVGKRSENDHLLPSFISMMETIQKLINDMNHMSEEHDAGDIDVFVPEEDFQGAYRTMAQGVNNMVKGHISVNKKAMACVDEFAKGNFDAELEKFPGKKAFINDNLEALRKNLKDVNGEITKLIAASKEGRLSERADAKMFQGGWAALMTGLNELIDIILMPINESVQVLVKMAVNDYTAEMSGQYKGKFQEFAEAINSVHARLLSVLDAFERVGNGDTSRLEEFLSIGKRSENDKLIPAFISSMGSIRNLISEAGMLADAAVKGDLSIRGNENKFKGGYREIIEGMNRTMEAVTKPIHEASSVMQEMSKGNLTVGMAGDYKGEYARIKSDLNSTIQSFNSVLNDINNAASQVATGSRQVSDSSQQLSQGATEQASSIQELTASLEEISAQTQQNAANAGQANELALSAKDDAVIGNEQMKEMLKAMSDINESSANISKIIKVIDDIAFQTNILALNAAVEAARAGQHGKGFAVVAEEVRNLAARSANAAKETTALIEGSIKKVEGGTKIASETANALNKIVDGVTKATTLVGEIACASNEQALGIAQVNQGIMQVSQVVQTNSATSEESAAASEELSSQAEMLKEMVGKFKLKKSDSISLSNLEELNPEIIKMIESMSARKKAANMSQGMSEAAAAGPTRIDLSDREFGKY